MKTVDARGQLCPRPLIMVKKALSETADNENMEIILDNNTSVKNVTRFLEEHQMPVHISKTGEVYRLLVSKTGEIPETTKAEDYCEVPAPAHPGYVIAFQKNTLGQGVEELGQLLIKGFINTLPDLDQKPTTLVFLNTGIFLALKDSSVLEALSRLQNEGIKILVCGTCLDYYQKKDALDVGIVSNMYDILGELSRAGKVLYP